MATLQDTFLLINVHPVCSLATDAAVCVKRVVPAAGALLKTAAIFGVSLGGRFHHSVSKPFPDARAAAARACNLPSLLTPRDGYRSDVSHTDPSSSLREKKLRRVNSRSSFVSLLIAASLSLQPYGKLRKDYQDVPRHVRDLLP